MGNGPSEKEKKCVDIDFSFSLTDLITTEFSITVLNLPRRSCILSWNCASVEGVTQLNL